MAFEIALRMTPLTCCHNGCGMVFGVPYQWCDDRRKDHHSWYCPNGHSQHFNAESEEERLRKLLASAQGNLDYYKGRTTRLSADVDKLERSRNALRGVATKLKKRAVAGVCAFCNRHFVDVERHMHSKHARVDTTDHAG